MRIIGKLGNRSVNYGKRKKITVYLRVWNQKTEKTAINIIPEAISKTSKVDTERLPDEGFDSVHKRTPFKSKVCPFLRYIDHKVSKPGAQLSRSLHLFSRHKISILLECWTMNNSTVYGKKSGWWSNSANWCPRVCCRLSEHSRLPVFYGFGLRFNSLWRQPWRLPAVGQSGSKGPTFARDRRIAPRFLAFFSRASPEAFLLNSLLSLHFSAFREPLTSSSLGLYARKV